jgi:hypothetical protein
MPAMAKLTALGDRTNAVTHADLSRAARHLIELYGSDAAKIAEQRAISLENDGLSSVAEIWRGIGRAARAIQGRFN